MAFCTPSSALPFVEHWIDSVVTRGAELSVQLARSIDFSPKLRIAQAARVFPPAARRPFGRARLARDGGAISRRARELSGPRDEGVVDAAEVNEKIYEIRRDGRRMSDTLFTRDAGT